MSSSMAFSISLVMVSARAFVSGAERRFDEDLAERFAQIVIHVPHAALPARLHFRLAAQILAVEIEIGVERTAKKESGALSSTRCQRR